jgi:hypothetical protein
MALSCKRSERQKTNQKMYEDSYSCKDIVTNTTSFSVEEKCNAMKTTNDKFKGLGMKAL